MKLHSGMIYVKQADLKEDVQIFGFRDLANQLPIDRETAFPTASLGKIFVHINVQRVYTED